MENLPLIIYDGGCIMCSRLAHIVVKHDGGKYHFADGNDPRVHEAFPAKQLSTDSTIYMVDEDGRWYSESSAIAQILISLDGIYPVIGTLIKAVPQSIADQVYRRIARNRKRLQKSDSCPVMSSDLAARMI